MTGTIHTRPVMIDPARFDAVIFDMDGVITDTAGTHAEAWTRLFDEYLTTVTTPGVDTRHFTDADYRAHLDGRARIDGVVTFLASRGIDLPLGTPQDPPGAATAWALANRKNGYFLTALDRSPPASFPSSVALVKDLKAAGLAVAVVTASASRAEVLAAAGLSHLFRVYVDGNVAAAMDLAGKPDPALFTEAAQQLDVNPARAVVVEDAVAGVAAGRRGGFGLVIGVDRTGNPGALRNAGADVVVTDLDQVRVVSPPDPTSNPVADDEWQFGYGAFSPAEEGRREALLSLGNGVFATRGAGPEATAGPLQYPGTYAAGLFNRLNSRLKGRDVEHESMVNLPNWLPLSFRPEGGQWLDLTTMVVTGYRQHLDLRRGILHRRFEVTDTSGRATMVVERRLVHMATPHLAALEWSLTAKNWSGTLEVRSGLDGTVENRNVTDEAALNGGHLTHVVTGDHEGETLWLTSRTSQSESHVALACRTWADRDGEPVSGWQVVEDGDRVEQLIGIDVADGQTVHVSKIAALRTSLDRPVTDIAGIARSDLDDVASTESLVSSHVLVWEQLWQRAHLDLCSTDPSVSRILNLHTFHVVQTLSPHIADRDVGMPARGLTGEGYRGHIFWDELFAFPYLTMRFPASARALLLYRYRRLPAARRMAAAMGCRGARFPWQSGSDGREETPTEFFNSRSGRWMADNSRRQHHVSLAIAYEVWQYHQVTGDSDFLVDYGAEMLVEISRFWVDFADLDPITGRYSIRGVMGPDEFHDGYPDRPGSGIDDNAYTNVMVSWLLRRALDAHRLLGDNAAELWEHLSLDHDELDLWDQVSRQLQVIFHGDGMISQFDGYEALADLDWDHYREQYGNIGRLDLILEAEGDSTNRYKAAKQADVLMLFYLFSAEELTDLFTHLGYHFDPAVIPATVDYYTSRMTHGSTLCRVVMAWVLARSDRARSWGIFCDALLSDVADIQGDTTREGVHLGAMAGTLDLVQRCYTGLEFRSDAIHFNPRLPDEVTELRFQFQFHNQHIDATVTHDRLELNTRPGAGTSAPVTVRAGGRVIEIKPHESVSISLPPIAGEAS